MEHIYCIAGAAFIQPMPTQNPTEPGTVQDLGTQRRKRQTSPLPSWDLPFRGSHTINKETRFQRGIVLGRKWNRAIPKGMAWGRTLARLINAFGLRPEDPEASLVETWV